MLAAKSGAHYALLLSLCLTGVLVSGAAAQGSGLIYAYGEDEILKEGELIGEGNWSCLWLGYGSGYVSKDILGLTPKASTAPSQTHSALVRSEFALGQNWDISVAITTDSQLRTKKMRGKQTPAPNPWEVAWLLADMKEDGSAGLYFILKTNGVELGAYRETGEQIYLFTGTAPKNRIGTEYSCRLVKIGNQITAFVDGRQVAAASLEALGGWPLGNRIGLYTEDAAARFGPVSVVLADIIRE